LQEHASALAMTLTKIVKQCRIDTPDKFKLADFDPAECFGLSTDIEDVRATLPTGPRASKTCRSVCTPMAAGRC
jgi:hypothetical protein